MPSPTHCLLVMMQIVSFLSFAVGPSSALPAGLVTPMPMPLVVRDGHTLMDTRRDTVAALRSVRPAPRGLNLGGLAGDIAILNNYGTDINRHASTMRSLTRRPPPTDASSTEYQKRYVTEANKFHTSLLGFSTLFDQLGRDKGLANYNRDDHVQTILKNLVNTNKDFLDSVDRVIEDVPGVGPILGPVVYNVKCVLDSVLNTVENTADGALNDLSPSLSNLINSASSTCCKSGLQLVGICLLG